MTSMRTLLWLLPVFLAACPEMAGASPVVLQASAKDDLYRSGQQALDQGRWNEAASIFGKVAERGGPDADAGLYWKAYAQHKSGRGSDALATVRQLASSFPKSAWLDDARALEVEVRADSGQPVQPSAEEDEELKLYALSGMRDSNPKRALPLVQQYLRGRHSAENKEKALFLLTQSEEPQARQTLLEIVRGAAHPELRRKAIEHLGMVAEEDPSVLKELEEIYRSNQDHGLRESVLDAYMMAEHDAGLLAAARSESDPKLRIHAIHLLGNVESPKVDESLRSLYGGAGPQVKEAVIDALSNRKSARALIEIFRAEKDREIRKTIVQRLVEMDSPEAEAFISQIFEKE